MALRSLGSTLLAKAGSGAALRTAEEAKKQGAVQQNASSAQVGSVQRSTIDQPLEKAVPEGTEKIVATAPVMQGKVSVDNGAPNAMMGMLPEMGGAAAAAKSNVPVSRLAESGAPLSAPVGQSKATEQIGAAPVSSGANLRTQIQNTFGGFLSPTQVTDYAKKGSQQGDIKTTAVQNEPGYKPSSVNPLTGWLTGTGSRVSADSGQPDFSFNRNFLQGIADAIGGAIDTAGKFVQKTTGYSPGEGNVSENLHRAASVPSNLGIFANLNAAAQNRPLPAAQSPYVQKAANTIQNVKNTVSNAGSNLRSQAQNVVNKVTSGVKNTASKVSNWLRSLW